MLSELPAGVVFIIYRNQILKIETWNKRLLFAYGVWDMQAKKVTDPSRVFRTLAAAKKALKAIVNPELKKKAEKRPKLQEPAWFIEGGMRVKKTFSAWHYPKNVFSTREEAVENLRERLRKQLAVAMERNPRDGFIGILQKTLRELDAPPPGTGDPNTCTHPQHGIPDRRGMQSGIQHAHQCPACSTVFKFYVPEHLATMPRPEGVPTAEVSTT